MKLYRAAISTAGMRAGHIYESEPDDERIVALLAAGFVTEVTKKEMAADGEQSEALTADDTPAVPTPDDDKPAKAAKKT